MLLCLFPWNASIFLHLMYPTTDHNMGKVNAIIIGVTTVIVLIVLIVLLGLLIKKRKSFQDIMNSKAAVAKSNSYKSSVGGLFDVMNIRYQSWISII